ncbi:MAG: transposase [Ignavibacteria bacterium]|nr:transposase [Ignavibacteria bacterium]
MIKNFFFFTATVLNWKHILKPDKYKDIIIESFKFLVNKNRVRIFAFVIMSNHYHTVWRINEKKDRKYQFWERNPLSVPLYSQKVVEQKINYIHGNPIKPKWNLAYEPQDYKYSSAGFYYTGKDEFGFLENYLEVLNER